MAHAKGVLLLPKTSRIAWKNFKQRNELIILNFKKLTLITEQKMDSSTSRDNQLDQLQFCHELNCVPPKDMLESYPLISVPQNVTLFGSKALQK